MGEVNIPNLDFLAFSFFLSERNLLCILMQVDHLELKILSCYFQNFHRLVNIYFIQNWINSFIETKSNTFKFEF
jgi:hypothetical protein